MHRTTSLQLWRLKVINGCDRNDDIYLPVVPQPSLLQSFYEQWSEEDEERHKTVEYIEARRVEEQRLLMHYKKKKWKKAATAAAIARRRDRIALRDWLQKIPHVPLGRHTSLPALCRLRHACVSRLQCRVVYVGDAATQRQILCMYPPVKHTLKSSDTGKGSCENGSNSGADEAYNDPAVFHGAHYRLLNCGLNPMYVNAELLPQGASRRLCEHDIVAFLEDPFDREGGVLQHLLPDDVRRPNAAGTGDGYEERSVKLREESECPVVPSAARMLFDGAGGSCAATAPTKTTVAVEVELMAGGQKPVCTLPVFLEVNGVRIARYRRPCVPPAAPLEIGRAEEAGASTDNMLFKQAPFSFAVDHKCPAGELRKHGDNDGVVLGVKKERKSVAKLSAEDGVEASRVLPRGHDGNLTPPPHQPSICEVRMKAIEELEGDEGDDILGKVVSPLQQRLVASPQCGRSGNTACVDATEARSFTIIPPHLPVYVFSRRSPSPVAFTRQAPSIGRFHHHPRQEEQQEQQVREDESCSAFPGRSGKEDGDEEMMVWVGEETSAAAAPVPGPRKRHRPHGNE